MESFPHGINASMSQELLLLKTECGLSGVAMYWHIREILYQNNGYITLKAYRNYISIYGQGEIEHVLKRISDYILNRILTKGKMPVRNSLEEGNKEQVFNTCSTRVRTGVQHVFMKDVLDDLKKQDFIKKIKADAGRKSAESRRLRTRVKNMMKEEKEKENRPENPAGSGPQQEKKGGAKEKKRLEAIGSNLERSAHVRAYARETGSLRIQEDPSQVSRLKRALLGSDSAIVDVRGTAQLVQTLCDAFKFPLKTTWAYVVQSRGKDSPAAYLGRILLDPQFSPADTAVMKAEQEMRSLNLI